MNWKKYLPTASEQGDWQGLLSTRTEYHALAIGLGVGVAAAAAARPELLLSIVMVAIGEASAQNEKMRQVSKEPPYALVGLTVGYLAVGFGVRPEALNRLVELLNLAGAV